MKKNQNKTNKFNLIKSLKGSRNGNNFCRTEAYILLKPTNKM